MNDAAKEVRTFLYTLKEPWRNIVIDPVQLESDESWSIPDTVPEICNNLIITAALVLLAYYDHVVKRLKRPRSPYLDRQLSALLIDTSDPVRMTGAQALTTLEWALECDSIPLLHRESLKARHVMFLSVIARERTDAHHRDYQRYFTETARAPVGDLVGQVVRAIAFLSEIEPELHGSAYAAYAGGTAKQRQIVRFPLGPFFANVRSGELLPFWRFDPTSREYVYQSLWSNREFRRPKPARADVSKSQHMVTALLSSSFRPLAELVRIASWYFQKDGSRSSLRQVLAPDGGRAAKPPLTVDEFQKDPVMGTWRLITEYGPVGFLERHEPLAEEVYRQVSAGDDDRSIKELENRTGEDRALFKRLLALEAARLLGLEVHSMDEAGQMERLHQKLGNDQMDLQNTDNEALPAFARDRLTWWSNEVERELRFLIVFYAAIPYYRGGSAGRVTQEDIVEIFEKPERSIHSLWNVFRKHVLGDEVVRAALRELTGRVSPLDGGLAGNPDGLIALLDEIAAARASWVHAKDTSGSRQEAEEVRKMLTKFLDSVGVLLGLLRGDRSPVRPIHPYLLTFKTAVYTSGGLTTLHYASHLGGTAGEQGQVVVYTSRHIDLARAYHCLPRVGQSEFGSGDKNRGRKSVLVDPFLVDAEAINGLVQRSLGDRS